MLFILTTMASVVSAKQERTSYKDCYVEINGELKNGICIFWKCVWFRPFHDNRAFVLWWLLGFDEYQGVNGDVTVKIFNQENGQEIWNHENQTGQWAIKLLILHTLELNNFTYFSLFLFYHLISHKKPLVLKTVSMLDLMKDKINNT